MDTHGRLGDCGKCGVDRFVVVRKGGDNDGRSSDPCVPRADRAALVLLRCRLSSVNRSRLGRRGTLVQAGWLNGGRLVEGAIRKSGAPEEWSRLELFRHELGFDPGGTASCLEPSC